jgi:hypothetical protein
MRNIFDYAKQLVNSYEGGSIEIADGLQFSQANTIREIMFMTNSKYLNGDLDRFGREKPYNNVVNGNVTIATVATDIDRKDIRFESDNTDDYYRDFVCQRLADNWMRDSMFGALQNKTNSARNRFGGVLLKKSYDEEGELKIDVVPWKNIAHVDAANIIDGVIIERHELEPHQVAARSDVWENTKEAIRNATNKSGDVGKITIYEINGILPKHFITDSEEDSVEYVRQKHYIAYKGSKFVTLYREEEKENPYKYRAFSYEEGRDLGRGIVESGMWAQIQINDAVLGEREAFDLGKKVILKSTARDLVGNAITDLDNGSIIELQPGTDINVMNLLSGNLPEFKNLIVRWQSQFDRSVQITDALRGETPPSGQSYRLGALTTQQSGSSFDYIREDMGFFWEEVFRDWVLPFLFKQYSTESEISSSLFSDKELEMLDTHYADLNTSIELKDRLFSGFLTPGMDVNQIKNKYRQEASKTGRRRTLKVPANYWKGYECRVVINTTNEQRNKMATLESLSNVLMTVSQNPAVLQDPVLKKIFGRILEMSGAGINPVEFENLSATQPQAGQQVNSGFKDSSMNLPGPQAITNG